MLCPGIFESVKMGAKAIKAIEVAAGVNDSPVLVDVNKTLMLHLLISHKLLLASIPTK